MTANGIAVTDLVAGLSSPQVQIGSFNIQCYHNQSNCVVELLVVGALFDGHGNRVWSFQKTVEPDDFDAKDMDAFLMQLLKSMIADQAIVAGPKTS